MKKNEMKMNAENLNETAKTEQANAAESPTKAIEGTNQPSKDITPEDVKRQSETVMRLSKRIEELEQQLRREPQTIEERIAYYKRKQELTERYEHYETQIKHLEELREQVEETNIDADDFSATRERYRVQIFAPHMYRDESVLSITNDALIDAVLDLLKSRMQQKAAELKAEISA